MPPHPQNLLTHIVIRKLKPGRHADGGGLYLLVDPSGAKRWLLRVVVDGKRRDIGLGGYSPGWEPKPGTDVLATDLHPGSIAAARREAARMRAIARSGGDPLADRNAARAEAKAKRKSFRDYATDYVKTKRPEWKNEKHAAQWTTTLERYAYPHFGDVAIGKVDRTMVLAALRSIWTKLPETASRFRGRLEAILDAAKADGFRSGDNPAEWAGSLQTSLPKHARKERIVHHPALPYRELSAFFADLRLQPGTAARALEFAILTAARTNEVFGATWGEMDEPAALWNVPRERMKAKKPHRVPLPPRAVKLLEELPRKGDFVFASRDPKKPMSNMAMLAVLKRMKRGDVTVHGFRSTFRDWAAEQTAYPREVIEHALAHRLADAAEAAYQRGDLLRKRRALMDDWAAYCATPLPVKAEVTPIRRKKTGIQTA